MINLLKTNLVEADLVEILQSVPRQPLLPPSNSVFWSETARNPIVQKWMEPLRARAETELMEPLPDIPRDLYAEFHRSGHRLSFDRPYFERRRRVARAAMCALIDGRSAGEKWIRSMTDKLSGIMEEVAWALPAHVSAVSGIDPMFIDLFAAETANLMAEMIDVFGEALPGKLQNEIRERLRTQIFENYLDRHAGYWWTRTSNNWNAVCHQGIIGAALALEEDAGMLARMLMLMRRLLPVFLDGFGEDGACSEGPGYWDYGFGWFTALNEQLEKRTAGRLSLFEGDEHIREIARYGPRVSFPFLNYPNFSDSGPSGLLRPATLAYLGERLDEESCRARAQANYAHLAKTGLDPDMPRQDFFHLARLFLYCPRDLAPGVDIPAKDFFFHDLGVVLAHARDNRGVSWDFAAKGGHNEEHHNHNDCGSYILYANGLRLISEIGAPEYVGDFFTGRRYEFLAARTLGHSLPIINGHEQAAGREFAASVTDCRLNEAEASLSVDATRCYPSASGCGSFIRHFHFDKAAGFEVRDEFELAPASALETAIITTHEVVLRDGKAEIKADGLTLRIVPLEDAVMDRVETHIYSAHHGNPEEIKRIVLVPARMDAKLTLGYTAELAP